MCLKELRDDFCMTVNAATWQGVSAELSGIYPVLAGISGTEADHRTGECAPTAPSDLMKEKQDAGNTPRYINDLLKVWRTWFNYLVEEGYLEERDNPAKKVKPLRQPRTIIDTFTAAEMKRMIQFYDGKDFWRCGTRPSSCCCLTQGCAVTR